MGIARELREAKLAVVCLTIFLAAGSLHWRGKSSKHHISSRFHFYILHLHTLTMPGPSVHHPSLNATFTGIVREEQGTQIHQFLGIKYASVPSRFERAEPVGDFEGAVVDATRYG